MDSNASHLLHLLEQELDEVKDLFENDRLELTELLAEFGLSDTSSNYPETVVAAWRDAGCVRFSEILFDRNFGESEAPLNYADVAKCCLSFHPTSETDKVAVGNLQEWQKKELASWFLSVKHRQSKWTKTFLSYYELKEKLLSTDISQIPSDPVASGTPSDDSISEALEAIRISVSSLSESLRTAPKTVLTMSEAAEYLGISVDYLYKLTERKEIQYYKAGGGKRNMFRIDDLDSYLLHERVSTEEEIRDQAIARLKALRNQRG